MILITGAAGKTGRALIRKLHSQGVSIRGFVRSEQQAAKLKKLGMDEFHIGDLTNPHDLLLASEDIQIIYHIPPNMHPNEVGIAKHVLDAAKANGVQRIVYHSVLHPQTEKMPHHWNKMLVEESLFESGLEYSVLQPTAYMQNLLANWQSICDDGIYHIPYPPESRISLVDLGDVVEAASSVLTSDKFVFGTYELVGTKTLTQLDVARIAGEALGKKVQAVEIPLARWRETATSGGVLSSYAIETLSAMFRYYADFGLDGNPFTLEAILGRPATNLETFFNKQLGITPC